MTSQQGQPADEQHRCPECDSVVGADDERCLMCGASLAPIERAETGTGQPQAAAAPADVAEAMAVEEAAPDEPDVAQDGASQDEASQGPGVFESTMRERQAPLTLGLTAGFTVVILIIAFLMLQNPAVASLAIFPTETPLPPTITWTPTWTPLASETSPPTETPTITPTPRPTETPQPPRSHTVASGETLFGISLRYGVSMESIADASGLPADAALQVSQQLLIPWPTATPPLTAVEVEIGGETVIADPTDCQVYEIRNGDTFFGIAAGQRIDLRALMAANRLTEQSVLQPGDTICIPKIIRGGVLPPTPGPSPTPSPTEPPAGASLLYPIEGAEVTLADEPLFLQWVAVKDLAEDEQYMVELTDLSAVDSHPIRGFTRQNSFQVPGSWRPTVPEAHLMRWRVTIVRVVGERRDGSFIYTFLGRSSQDAYFTWVGAVPTPTPTASPTPVPTAAG
jgi:LysM repeat protein